MGHGTVRPARFGAVLFHSHTIRRSVPDMREPLTNRRLALQALLALGGGLCSRSLLAEPNFGQRLPGGGPEDLAGSLAEPEPLFAAPTRLDRIGRVMTAVMVNGKGPFRFVIDTGASRSTLSPHLAKALGLTTPGRNVILNGVTGAAEVPTVAVDKLEIGELKFENQHLPVIYTSIMGNADGILGVAGFADQRIDVDFKKDRVSVVQSN